MWGIFGAVFGVVFALGLLGIGTTAFVIWLMVQAVRSVRRRLRGEVRETKKLEPPVVTRRARHDGYVHLNVDNGATSQSVEKIMREYVHDPVVGEYAQDVLDTLEACDRRRQSLNAQIDGEFERQSMSWEKFSHTANEAFDAILHNCALLANRVQSFDVDDYQRMQEFYRTGGFAVHGMPDEAKLQRWKLLDETKREMDDIRSTNGRLLLELDKLATELAKLSAHDFDDERSDIEDEVRKLVDETKYYR